MKADLARLRAENASIHNQMIAAIQDMKSGNITMGEFIDNAYAILAKAGKPDYAPARDPSDHLACGNVG